MKQLALLKKVDSIIEEEVTLKMGDIEFTGFATVCPYKIYEGNQYQISIGLTILDELVIEEACEDRAEIIKIGESFSYLIRGLLKKDGIIDAGIIIEDDILKKFSYYEGKYVEFKVDRISIEFL